MVGREILTGFVVGCSLSAAFLPFALFRWGHASVCVAVSMALFAACSTATAVAMVVPWLFHRSGRDPAFGSGPLGTVLQDLVSILVYLVIAMAVVG
jgi:magnesium transporter